MDILATLRDKAEQAEVYEVQSESTLISFEANETKSAKVEETRGIALRCVADGRLGFTASSGRSVEAELVGNLLASARFGDQVPIRFPELLPGPDVQVYDPDLADVPISRFVEIGREIVETLRDVDPDVQVNIDIRRGLTHATLRNSAGAEAREKSSSFVVVMSVERVRGDDVLVAYEVAAGTSLIEATPARGASDEGWRGALARLARKVELAKRPATLRSGRLPVLFSPTGVGVLALPLMLAINGKNVLRGISPLAGKQGEQVFDQRITVWDDPTLDGHLGSSSHDGEGVPSRRKALISRGICQGFLYDLKTAALMGVESTGNGSRTLFSMPSPSPTNLVMEPGETPLAELVADIDKGLWVEGVLGLGQGNPMSGAFSNTVGLAYAIEGGEIAGRVKDVSIAGNIYEDMRQISGLSRERFWAFSGMMSLPYVLLPDLNVVCKE